MRETGQRLDLWHALCGVGAPRNGLKEKLCEFACDVVWQLTFLGDLYERYSLRVALLNDDTSLAKVSDLSIS